jgi:hypothetical protein
MTLRTHTIFPLPFLKAAKEFMRINRARTLKKKNKKEPRNTEKNEDGTQVQAN